MICPYCHHAILRVIDSRDAAEFNATRRRRECLGCNRRFTTFETIEIQLQVLKRDGRYEDFQRQKLINGIAAACRHTKLSYEQAIAIATDIERELTQRPMRAIDTTELGEIVMRQLQSADPIAYIRFACVYCRFKDMDELMKAIQAIEPKDHLLDRKKERQYAPNEK